MKHKKRAGPKRHAARAPLPESKPPGPRLGFTLGYFALALYGLHAAFCFLYGGGLWGPWPLTWLLLLPVAPLAAITLTGSLIKGLTVRGVGWIGRSVHQGALLLLLGACIYTFLGPSPYHPKEMFGLGARWRVQRLSNEARLQSWAADLLTLPDSELPLNDPVQAQDPYRKRLDLDLKRLPEFVTALVDDPRKANIVREHDGTRYVRLALGGWFDGQWDLILGGPELADRGWGGWRRWRDGVYLSLR